MKPSLALAAALLVPFHAFAAEPGLWLHPKATPMPGLPLGPFVHLDNGAILTIDGDVSMVSEDGGATWTHHPIFEDPEAFEVRPEAVLLRSRTGTVVLGFSNDAERVWKWNKETGDADEGTTLPTYVVLSHDGGRTWDQPQKLHDDWTGANREIIQTESGAIVFTSMMLLHDPGRHATITYTSTDDGQTWQRSNLIDLGGAGHHDGGIEATLVELRDGRLWMLLRTTLDAFWQAYSDDGRYWRTLGPTTIDASCAPPALRRLASGRLMMAWNRLLPEGATDYPRRGGDGQWSQRPAINHREELSISFSEDDGHTWSTPVVVARLPGKRLSYPFIFETTPGTVWLTTWQGKLRLTLDEKDFVEAPATSTPAPDAEG